MSEHSNHNNNEQIIDNLLNTKDIQISEHLSSLNVEDTSLQDTTSIINPPLPISSVVTPAPQDRWSQDKNIELVNIIGNPRAGMLIRAMAKQLSAALAHACLFVDFLSEEEPKKVFEALKHPGWVDAMQDELNQFAKNKVWTLVPTTAFLNGKLKEEAYVKQPIVFESNEFPNHIKQSEKGISINQEKYVKDLLKKYDINGSSVKTPMVPPNNLGPNLSGKVVNETPYRGVVRVDQYSQSWKSTSGACHLLGGKLVCWSAKKQQYIAMSSAEAEYVAAARCCANIIWMKSQLIDYDIIYEKVPIFCGNTSAIAILNNPVLHSRTKHIDIRYHFIRDHILKGDIELHFIPTQYQLADIFTNPLDEPTFKRLIIELDQIEFSFNEIVFTTNNEVALLYPSYLNSEYFREVSDFISKYCLKEAFTRAPTQYKEYLCKFWYTAKTLDDSKTCVSTLIGGIRGDIGYSGEIGAKGTLKKSCLPTDGSDHSVFRTHHQPHLGLQCSQLALKPSSQAEKVPQGKKPEAKSGLRRKHSLKHISESYTEASKSKTSRSEKETQSNLAKDKSPSHPSPPTPVSASGCDASADSIAEADPELSTPNDSILHNKVHKLLSRVLRNIIVIFARTFRVILFSIHNDEWKSFQCHHQTALRSNGDEIQIDDKLNFIEEPVKIMDREVKRLKQSSIPIVKFRWNSRRGPEFNWERKDQMKKMYPHFFTNSASTSKVTS
ncbi:hypothetical protein Tco_0296701 [Tanacetum coccineum]